MKELRRAGLSLLWVAFGSGAFASLTQEQIRSLPPPASRAIAFSRDIQPIFEASCIKCHGRGRDKGGFQIDTRETLLKGGDSGPAAVVGKSQESHLIELVSGLDPDNVMPKKGKRLNAAQVGLLRAWIDQGLPWDASVSFARPAPLNLAPPAAKVGIDLHSPSNPIDQILEPYFKSHGVKPPRVVEDRVFARRAYLDTIGLLPPKAELEAFLADTRTDKRTQLVRRLLADDREYAQHWLSFWNDLLRNDYRGTGYIDGGRKQITAWLFGALTTNLPYDKFVAQLINPTPESEGFAKGIVWRGAVNASQTPQMQAAQNISQVFMGVNLKCASCHDSFINDWRLADAYGLACIYNDGPLQMFQCDKPTGKMAHASFIYPQLGEIDPNAEKAARQARLADLITGPQDGRLSRTIVNRFWAQCFGHGLVEPVDDMEQPAWNQDLLDWLAQDLVAHQYNLKHTLERLLTSRAYQLPTVNLGESRAKEYVFHGPGVRRLSAEEFRDALSQLTGVWYEKAEFAAETNQIRACLVAADPLAVALGRPNREQVITTRSSAATTLQALELTNGETLTKVLERGAQKLLASAPSADALVDQLYRQAFGRRPTGAEQQLAFELVGQPARQEGVQDLLWAMSMVPEFQLIY
jgi:mono/diheme cytochrome c family protein